MIDISVCVCVCARAQSFKCNLLNTIIIFLATLIEVLFSLQEQVGRI